MIITAISIVIFAMLGFATFWFLANEGDPVLIAGMAGIAVFVLLIGLLMGLSCPT